MTLKKINFSGLRARRVEANSCEKLRRWRRLGIQLCRSNRCPFLSLICWWLLVLPSLLVACGSKEVEAPAGFQFCCFDRRPVYSPSVENLHWRQPPLHQTTCLQNRMVWLFVSSQRGLDTISIIINIGPIYVESSST